LLLYPRQEKIERAQGYNRPETRLYTHGKKRASESKGITALKQASIPTVRKEQVKELKSTYKK